MKPSARGNAPAPRSRIKSSWWRPARISLAPNYLTPMAGEPMSLRIARKEWAKGNPAPLRNLLAQPLYVEELKEAA